MIRNYQNMSETDKIMWIILFFQVIKNNPYIKAKLAEFNYDDAKIAEGVALLEKTQESQFSKSSTNQIKISAHSVFKSLFVTIEKEYNVLTEVSTVALRKLPDKAVKLAVNKGKSKKQIQTLDDIVLVCHLILDDDEILQNMNKFGFPKQRIQELYDSAKNTKQLYIDSAEEKNEYHSLVTGKNQSFEELEEYLIDLIQITRIAFKDEPEILDKLGL